ncbi:MAG TPA: gamma-glutamyltransferase [Thermoanaerobaculia bacterium]|nr:gamma-glutamyltransferase [Thermoanaerobaculia bacterium]
MRSCLPVLLAILSMLPDPQAAQAASRPAPIGTGGAVASADPLATEAGLEMLRAGGNAVDAAVATALALAVVYPEAGNLGGGGFAVMKIGDDLASLDFREVAPAAARHDMYLDEKGEPVKDASLIGPLAAGVPGSPAGLHELHRRYGKLPWAKVVAPAVRLARAGLRVDPHLRTVIEEKRALLSRFPEASRVWLPKGELPAVGTVIPLPELAATMERYAAQGPEAVTAGPVAAAVEAAARKNGGVLTAADLAAYRPVWRDPLVFEAFGWKFASMPLPSSGGIILGQTLQALERLEWGKLPRFGADRWHLLTETWRRSFADRYLMGDPATTKATAAQLLDPAWIEARARSIDRQRATPSADIHPWPGKAAALPAAAESAETTHLSVVDGAGNLVALTTTLNGLFGSGVYVQEAGFFLNNEMDDFTTAPGRPNNFGLIQGEANAVAPGKRMLSAMTPTIAWKGNEAIAVGGRGGSRIPTQTTQVLLNLLVDNDPLQAALDRPRLHHQWLPDRLDVEPDALAPETWAELERRGHKIEIKEGPVSAKVYAVRRRADGRVEAAADSRSTGDGGIVNPER